MKKQVYLVFVCPKCGSLRSARSEQKTALCYKCGYRIKIDPSKIQILAKKVRVDEAIAALKEYKRKG